jgi:hypothetical protein
MKRYKHVRNIKSHSSRPNSFSAIDGGMSIHPRARERAVFPKDSSSTIMTLAEKANPE